MRDLNKQIIWLETRVTDVLGIGRLKAVILGICGTLYAHLVNDQYLLILTIGFTLLAYIVYAMAWGLEK